MGSWDVAKNVWGGFRALANSPDLSENLNHSDNYRNLQVENVVVLSRLFVGTVREAAQP